MWCDDCGSEVWVFEEGYICRGCGRTEPDANLTHMPATQDQPNLTLNGVRYVPAITATPSIAAITHTLISDYYGDDWQTEAPDAPQHLRVILVHDQEIPAWAGEGETAEHFAARLAQAAQDPPT